ncbi:MAG: thiamine-phosphate kinase [Sneathiella sp.]
MSTPADHTGEFGIISQYLSPLSHKMEGALGLQDDAALLECRDGYQLVLTKDAMVAGVHFLPGDAPPNIARKLLRTNLSDLAAMGAAPVGYLLSTAWTADCTEEFIAGFTAGLKADQDEFGLGLLGGDTVRTPGPLTLSLTAIGELPKGQALRRNGAAEGDYLYVSGTIGDSALGLLSLQGKLENLATDDRSFLESRYHIPKPRLTLGQVLCGYASACLDISDGLLADIGHICEQSEVGAVLYEEKIPISRAAETVLCTDKKYWAQILSGGDDYELAFAIPREKASQLEILAAEAGVSVTRIGEMTGKGTPVFINTSGQKVTLDKAGWTHF